MNTLLLVLTPLIPLLTSLALFSHRWRDRLTIVPFAAAPALAAALFVDPDARVSIPYVVLGVELGLDEIRRPFLALTALLWIAAGFYARGYMGGRAHPQRFGWMMAMTMAGNLGLIVALDVPSFYVFFSIMTLSTYVLVVFDQSERAYTAGRVYIVLAIVGEAMLLFGLMRAVAVGGIFIADIPAALADERAHGLTLLLLVTGFFVKAGQFPLHIWLPLAHPAAPTPASAVLSGALIKAGLLGLLLFLPLGHASLPLLGTAMVGIGLLTAFYGAACGLPQTDIKTVLAYSSMSQMGLMVCGVGIMLIAPAAAVSLLPAVIVYAVHHGLAKGALFLATGPAPETVTRRQITFALAALGALAIAGAPLTAGAVVKLALKDGIELADSGLSATASMLLSLSAVVTTLLMLRFLALLRGELRQADHGGAPGLAWMSFVGTAALSQALPWAIAIQLPLGAAVYALSASGLWESVWPVAIGFVIAAVALQLFRATLQRFFIPEGDWFGLLPPASTVERLGEHLDDLFVRRSTPVRTRLQAAAGRLLNGIARMDARLSRPAAGAFAIVLVAAGLVVALMSLQAAVP